VIHTPERYHAGDVIWGGRIIEVRNGAEASELLILAYPLDIGQRPRPKEGSYGRFVAVLPGYVESFDYPQGRFISVVGRIDGARAETVDGHDDLYPWVQAETVHLWPPGFENSGPQIHFGIGISGAIR
jgi:outer membrane lipoprotein